MISSSIFVKSISGGRLLPSDCRRGRVPAFQAVRGHQRHS